MNLALFMLTFMLSGLYATESYSQTVRISLNMKNSTVKEVLKKIENCSEFTFFYNDEIIDVDKRVTLNAEDLSISDILTTILPNCSYTISNKNIIITVKEAGVHQQGKIVTGVVRDVNGEPVVGANVSVKGTTNGTITDMDGKFTLEGVSADSKLSVSYIGYMAQEIVVGNKGAFEIVLKDDTQALEEVVVVGYAAQKKVNLTGSVASLNFTDEKLSRPVTTIAASLSGMAAGVNVMNTSSQPNAEGSSILIRGVGTMNDAGPLILVDGMEMSLNEVNPNDVASISILKDAASCAIYGNRGANGVILVTTKRGSDGKINVTYSGKFSYQTPAKLIRQVTDYADYMEFVNEGYLNTNQAAKFSQSTINEWREAANNPNATNVAGIPNYVTHPNTDWYDVVYDPKWMQEHTISLTGAEKRTNYAISGTYLNNPGLVIESGVKKYYLRSDIESRVTDFLTVGMRAWGYNADQDRNNLGDMWGLNMQKVTPGVYPYYDGKYGGIETNEEDGQAGNPLLNMSNSYGYYKQNKYFVNPYIEVKFLKDFKFTANFYYDQFTNHHRWQPSDYKEQYSFNRTMTLSTPPTSTDMATYKVYDWERREKYWKTNMLVSWAHTYGKHDVGALIGYEESRNWGDEVDICKEGMSSVNLTDFDAMTDPYYIKGSSYEYSSRSWFGRINYAFDNRYLFEMNMRYDGSSRFSPDSRWGLFPSFSAGWVFTNEKFMAPINNILSFGKFRASWGSIGDQSVSNTLYKSILSDGQSSWLDGSGNKTPMFGTPSLVDSDISWQQIETLDFGVDLRFFNNKFGVTFDWFQRDTKNMIIPGESLPVTLGAAAPSGNYGSLRTKGWELSADFNHRFANGLGINATASISDASTFITRGADYLTPWEDRSLGTTYSTGRRYGDIYGFVTDRLFQKEDFVYGADGQIEKIIVIYNGTARTTYKQSSEYPVYQVHYEDGNKLIFSPGDTKFVDLDGDGYITPGTSTNGNPGDQTVIGNTTPRYEYSFRLGADYKGFDFSIYFQGIGKRKIWGNGQLAIPGYNAKEGALPKTFTTDYWTEERTNAFYPRAWDLGGSNTGFAMQKQSRYLLDMSYLRIKNITLGYTVPTNILSKIYISKARVYMSLENFFTFDNLRGLPIDPEAISGYSMFSTNYNLGRTGTGTPVFKSLSCGVQLTF